MQLETSNMQLEDTSDTKPFRRVNAKKFFLTYSQVPHSFPPESVYNQLKEKVNFREYVIREELHKDGGKHFHVVLISNTKQHIRNVTMLNLEFEGKSYMCDCRPVRKLANLINYICKDGSYISNMKNLYKGTLMCMEELVQKMSDDAAFEYLDENYPKFSMASKSLVGAEKYLRCRQRLKRRTLASIKEASSTPFKLSDFLDLEKLRYWRSMGGGPALILVGKAGCGKTQYAKALAEAEGWNLHIVNSRESLKRLTDDAIFFCDMSFEDVDAAAFLAFLETNDDRDLRVLHSSIV